MFNINQNFALKSAELFNFERDAYGTTADLFKQPLTYFPDRFVVTVTSDGSRYQLDKSKAPSNKLTPTDTLSDAERRACWLPLPTVADKSKMANMVTSTGLKGGTITIAAGDGKAVKSLANGSVGQILKIGTDGLKWADEKTYSADNGLTLNPSTNTFSLNAAGENVFGGVKLNKGGLWIDDETNALSIKASNNSGLNIDVSGELSVKTGSGLTISNADGSVELSKSLTGMTLTNTTLTGITTTPTPNGNQGNEVTNVTYVDTKIESAVGGLSKALVFIGEVSGGITPSNAKVGYVYVVTDNKTYAGQKCEPGDTLICKKEGIQTSDGWIVVEKNIDGAVTASSELSNGAIVVGSGGTKVHTIATPSTQGLVLQTTGSGFGWKEPAKYQLTAAAKGKMGGVSIGDGIKVTSDGTISLSGGTGISITSDTISNTGVISVTGCTSANQISVTKGGKDSIITINNVEHATEAAIADKAYVIAIDTESSGDDVLVVGRYIPGANIGPVAGTTPPEFKATSTISSYKIDESTIYEMDVSFAQEALSACKVVFPLIIKPLNDKGELDKNVDGKNWIEYDGSLSGEGLDAITWGDIDKLFNATPTV